MSRPYYQLNTLDHQDELRVRLRSLGLVLATCSASGELVAPFRRGEEWMFDLFCLAPLMHDGLRKAARIWQNQHEPAAVEALPGLWLIPVSLIHRRRRVGYAVAITPTEPFLDAEQLVTMCNATGQDLTTTRRMLADLPPVAEIDVHRIAAFVRFAHEDQQRAADDSRAMEDIGRQLGESYEELNLLYSTIQSMTEIGQPHKFVSTACSELRETLPFLWTGALIADTEQLLAGELFVSGLRGESFDELRPMLTDLLQQTSPDTPIVLEPATKPDHLKYRMLGRTAIIHPVSCDGEVHGILVAGDRRGDDTAVTSVDIKLLAATASHLSIFLKNANLYDDLEAMVLGTLEALTASIDAKDPYTCGHSLRVAHLTEMLAMAIGLDEHRVSRLHMSGLVHDVGKIGVPEAVLTKNGRLTPDEYEEIKKHPEIGYRILKDVPQLADVLPGVLHHHERWDGGGYPHGLIGEDIPLMGRLIALADAFDAMSSSRTYRVQLSRDEAFREIHDCAGTQFDPKLAPIFVSLDFSQFDRMLAESREDAPGRAVPPEKAA